jgi:hypothetical protein
MNRYGENFYQMEGNALAKEQRKANVGMPNTSICPVCNIAKGAKVGHAVCSKILQRKFAGLRQ